MEPRAIAVCFGSYGCHQPLTVIIMRIGTIDRITTEGDLVHVFVHVDGDIEGPYPVLDPWGVRVDIVAGQPMMLVAIDGALAEFAAIPAFWRKASEGAKVVAFKSDADALNTRITALESAVNVHIAHYVAHSHTVILMPSPLAIAPPLPAPVPPPASTSATVEGSSVFKAR